MSIVGVINAALLSAFITPLCLIMLDLYRNYKFDGWFVFTNLFFFNEAYMPLAFFLKSFFAFFLALLFIITFFRVYSKNELELAFKGRFWFSLFMGNFLTFCSTIFFKGFLRILGFGFPIVPLADRPISGFTGFPINWDNASGFPFPFWHDLSFFWPINFGCSFFFWFLLCYLFSREIIKHMSQEADTELTT